MVEIVYQTDWHAVDWAVMKTILRQDAFDNGRSPQQLKASFENSYAAYVAYANQQLYQFAEFGLHIKKVCSPLQQGGSDSGGYPICSATLQNWY